MSPSNQDLYSPVAEAAANQYGVPVSLFQWQIGQESSWNPNASNGNAQGIAQFIPSTAAAFHVDVNDPVSSIYGAAAYDASLYAQYGDWTSVLNHYGTVGSKSPSSVIDAANAQLAAVGAQPISGTQPATPSTVPSVWNTVKTVGTTAYNVATAGSSLFDVGITRLAYIAVGLLLIGGGLYTLKPVQSLVSTTVKAASKVAAKGTEAAAAL